MKAFLWACASAACALGSSAAAVASSGAQPASVVLRGSEADTGFLDVSSEPPGARIFVDDGDTGQATPQHRLPVKAGVHKLTLVESDGRGKLTVGFTVRPHETSKLTLHFAKRP